MRITTRIRRGRAGTQATRGAFTLVELTLSMAVTTLLLGAMASTVLLAARAIPDGESPAEETMRCGEVANQIAGELTYAISFTELTENAVTFRVADRDGDNFPETIRYSWSGQDGDPLLWQYNDDRGGEILTDVHGLTFSFDREEITEIPSTLESEGAETLLLSHDVTTNLGDFVITPKSYGAQYFRPALPPDAVGWRVTRVAFMARSHAGAKGVTSVQLRLPTSTRQPSDSVIAAVSMEERNLSNTYLWEEFGFADVPRLSPTQGLSLVFEQEIKDAHLADVVYELADGSNFFRSTDGGKTWSPVAGAQLLYFIYGRVTRLAKPEPVTRTWLRSIGIGIQAGSSSAGQVDTSVRTLNTPEVTGL